MSKFLTAFVLLLARSPLRSPNHLGLSRNHNSGDMLRKYV